MLVPRWLLVYAVLFWEQEWKAWEENHKRGQPLRLTPVIPLVLYTGQQPWNTSRCLADLFEVPPELQPWLPDWHMPLWDLPEHPVEKLLESSEPWWQALAVARAEKEAPEEIERVLGLVLRGLEPLGLTENVYWHQLVRLVLGWSLYRRPRREHAQLVAAARDSQSNVKLQQEIEKMNETLEKTWEEELTEKLELRVASAVARGVLIAYRQILLKQLEDRFGTLAKDDHLRVASADLEHLKAAVDQLPKIASLQELNL